MNEIEYVCECDHTRLMHTIHDGCQLCDCERNRAEVVTIGLLIQESNYFREKLRDTQVIRDAITDLLIKSNKQLDIAINTLKRIRGTTYPNGVPDSMLANDALEEIEKIGNIET
jgi:hypothetical protein